MNLFHRTKNGKKVWYIHYTDESGRRRQKSTGTSKKSEAITVLKKFEINHDKKKEIKLGDFADNFFDYETSEWIQKRLSRGKNITSDTAKFKESLYKNHIKEKFGKYKLKDIKAHEIDKWLLNQDCSNQTKNHILYTLSQILQEAEYQEIIEINPCRKIEKFADNHKKKIPINHEDLYKLFPISDEQFNKIWPNSFWGTMFLLMVSSGMRSGEARALQWKHIQWEMGAILVVQGLSNSDDVKSTKSGYGRGVYVPDIVFRKLSDLRNRDKYIDEEDFIFCNTGGEPIDRKWVYTQFKRGLKNAGLEIEASPHTLRHTYNVMMRKLLAEKNLPESLLRAQIGHKSEKMTDRYDNADLIEKMKRSSVVLPAVRGFWEN